MRKRDARSLDHKTLEEMRRLAVSRVLAGESQIEVAWSLQVNRTTVVRWMMAYRRGGEAALAARKATGRPPTLSRRQERQVRDMIVGKNPRQLGFGMALWTIPLVRLAIERRFGLVLHETTVSRLLRRLGLTPQRPTRRAFQRDERECRRWATEEFPRIVRLVRRKQGTLLFLDESAVHEDGPVGTTWGLRGQRPVVRVSGTHRRINVISAVSPRGRLWFRCYPGTLTAAKLIEFLEALLHDLRGFLVLVVDRHPAHQAAATRRWLMAHRSRMAIHYLPPYAPDMNPDEQVWGYLKGLFRREPLERFEDLESAVESAMGQVQNDPALVRRFFEHPEVAYVKEALHW